MNRHVALAATMRFSHVFPLVAVAALLAACGDEGTDPSNSPSNTAPTAAFAAQCNPLTCTFANSSTDTDGTIEGYDWDFGDHGPHVTTRDAVHTYPAPGGRFTVTLTVTDDDGETATATREVDASEANVAPTADFTVSCTDLTCTFSDGSSDGNVGGSVASYAWDFGDGETSTEANPVHGYAATGHYLVALTVTDDVGATGPSPGGSPSPLRPVHRARFARSRGRADVRPGLRGSERREIPLRPLRGEHLCPAIPDDVLRLLRVHGEVCAGERVHQSRLRREPAAVAGNRHLPGRLPGRHLQPGHGAQRFRGRRLPGGTYHHHLAPPPRIRSLLPCISGAIDHARRLYPWPSATLGVGHLTGHPVRAGLGSGDPPRYQGQRRLP